MKTKLLLLFFCFTLTVSDSFACLNYYVVDNSGRRHTHSKYPPSNIYLNTKYEIQNLRRFESYILKAPSNEKYKYISDYCATLIKLGRYKESIPILKNLLKENPDAYEINANLAVALELDGQLDQALMLLEKSLAIRPDAHNGSEWFHLRFLKTAIELRNNNTPLQKLSVLQLENLSADSIARHISYQLDERVPLTKPPNILLSKTLEESGDFYKTNISIEWAIELYAIAIAYTDDEKVKQDLWIKINTSRQRLVYLRERGTSGDRSLYLFDRNWQKLLTKTFIRPWADHAPFHYSKPVKTSF